MPPSVNASYVVVRGYWWDEYTGYGVDQDITFEPVPLSGAQTPNVRDVAGYGWLRTAKRTVRPSVTTGFYAVRLLANNDPDLDGFGGWKVTFTGYDPFTVEVPHNALTTTVNADVHEQLPDLVVGSTVRALWLVEAANAATPAPTPPSAYLTQSQTLSAIATAIADHEAAS